MTHKPRCPRCVHHPTLDTASINPDSSRIAFGAPRMLICPNCNRWYRHTSLNNKCGLVSTIKPASLESFSPCHF